MITQRSAHQPQPQYLSTRENAPISRSQPAVNYSTTNRQPPINTQIEQQPIITSTIADNNLTLSYEKPPIPMTDEMDSEVSPPTYNEALNLDRINFDSYKKSPSFDPTDKK